MNHTNVTKIINLFHLNIEKEKSKSIKFSCSIKLMHHKILARLALLEDYKTENWILSRYYRNKFVPEPTFQNFMLTLRIC